MSQINFQDIVIEWLKMGPMLIVSRIFSGESLQDQAWQRSALYTLLGFTTYYITTKNFIGTEQFGEYKPIADTWFKFGTMMIVSHLLAGGSLTDRNWQMGSLYTLLGFTAYNLLTSKFIQGNQFAENPAVVTTINNWVEVGTMLVVSRLLGGGNLQDRDWQRSSLGTIVGYSAYDFLSRL